MRIKHHTRLIATSLIGFCTLFSSSPTHAFPGWAKKAAKSSQKINIDPRAEFITLLNKIEIKYFPEGRSYMKVRRAYKILSVSGAEDFEFFLQTTPKRKLAKFHTWTLSPSGEEREGVENSINYIPISRDYNVYMDDRYAYLKYADLKIGSIVVQEYEVDDHDLGTFFSEFIIQRQQPTLEVELRAQAPEGWKMYASGLGISDLEFEEDGQWYIWKGKQLPFQPNEPLSPSWNYLTRRVGIACYNPAIDSLHDIPKSLIAKNDSLTSSSQFFGWSSVSRWVEDIYDPIAIPDSAVRHIVDSLSELSANQTELVTKIAEFASKQIRYVSVSIGDGRFVPHSVSSTMTNGYGDCKDKTTLTRAMLSVAGVPSVATLTSIEHLVNPHLPSPYQFDHCIVGIPLTDSLDFTPHVTIGDKRWLFIDPTDYITPIGELPAPLMGGSALVANHDDSTFLWLPYPETSSWRKKTIVNAAIKADGSMEADISVIDYGAYVWYAQAMLEAQTVSQIKQGWIEGAEAISSQLELSKFDYQCFADSCVVSFHLEDPKYALHVGDELICKVNPFGSSRSRQLSVVERQHPIWFGPPSTNETVVTWQLPTDAKLSFEIDTLTLESKTGEAIVTFSRDDSNNVIYRSLIEISGILLYADEYELALKFDAALAGCYGGMFGVTVTETMPEK